MKFEASTVMEPEENMEPPVILEKGRNWYLVEKFEGELHTHHGIIKLEELKGKSYGDIVRTHLGVKYKIVPFSPSDFFRFFKRSATPVMPKDIGAIIAYSALSPDSLILDAGTGSGMVAAYLAYFNRYGEVVTVEKRKEFARVARQNFRMAGLKNIHQIVGDVRFVADGFKKEFDLIFLDMKDDAEFVGKAKEILRSGGHLAVYNPYIEATKRVYEEMVKHGFFGVESFELVKIDLEFKRVGTRPTSPIFHTGYITIGRKV